MVAYARASLALAVLVVASGCVATTPAIESRIDSLQAVLTEDGGVLLTWNEDPRGTADAFAVYRDTRKIATVQAPDRSYLDTSVVAGRTYMYQVSGLNAKGDDLGPLSSPVNFTFTLYLGLDQDSDVNRGYVNFTVVSRSPILRWSDLVVTLDRKPLPRSASGFLVADHWTHANPRDDVLDLGERLQILAPGQVRRNVTLAVSLDTGERLFQASLEGRPYMNLSLKQDREAAGGRVALTVTDVTWRDAGRAVILSDTSIAPRWSALDVLVDDTLLRPDRFLSNASWSHSNPNDAVIRAGESLTIRLDDGVDPGTRITIMDAQAGHVAAMWVVKSLR